MEKREWTRGGFTFNGKHSSEFGVFETPNSVNLLPEKRRSLITIPGRSRAFIQEDGGYNASHISLTCSYVPKEDEDLQKQIRQIAKWLNGVGELSLDHEAEMFYKAYLESSTALTKNLAMNAAQFTLDFVLFEPFAYERTIIETVPNLELDTWMILEADGTAPTPVRITITNNGVETLQNISITLTNQSI